MKIASIQLDHLITFCKIFNSFDSMCKDILDLFDYYDDEMAFYLERVACGTSNDFHAKLFYNKHKDILDFIHKECGITDFFLSIYDCYGYFNDNFRLFYHYIRHNKENLNDILDLLLKIKNLGVSKITLDLINNLKSLRHGMYKNFNDNESINYVTDIEFLPEYGDRIIYKSNSGDYILKLKVSQDGFYKNTIEIVVSNLLFDKESLPSEVSKDSIYGKIIDEKTKVDMVYNAINNTVELNKIINDLNVMLSKLSKILDSIDGDNSSYTELYEELINRIIELENIRDEYEIKVMNDYSIDRKEIEYQKSLGLK